MISVMKRSFRGSNSVRTSWGEHGAARRSLRHTGRFAVLLAMLAFLGTACDSPVQKMDMPSVAATAEASPPDAPSAPEGEESTEVALLQTKMKKKPAAKATKKPAKSAAKSGSKTAAASSGDWAGFRGPSGMGVSNATDLPVTWSADENMVWKTPLPGPGASSPIVFGDRIYITCYTGYFVPGEEDGNQEDLKRHLIALDRESGKIVWDKAVAAKLPEEKRIRDHGFAANTPAADSERVYVFLGKTGVFAYDHEGEQLWQSDVGDGTHGWGTAASPVLYKDLVFINASVESGALVALDCKTGKEKWRAEGIRESWNTPVLIKAESGREELVLAIQGKVLSFNPDTGEPYWSCKTDIGWYMVPSVVAENGIVYCLGGRSGVAALAVRAGGTGDVTETHRLWTSQKGSNVASPVVHEGHLYWMHEQRGVACCAKCDSGEIVYEERLEGAGQVYSSAILAGGRVYYLTREGAMFVLAATPKFEQLAKNDIENRGMFNGSPAVTGNRLLIRSDKFLYCVGK